MNLAKIVFKILLRFTVAMLFMRKTNQNSISLQKRFVLTCNAATNHNTVQANPIILVMVMPELPGTGAQNRNHSMQMHIQLSLLGKGVIRVLL